MGFVLAYSASGGNEPEFAFSVINSWGKRVDLTFTKKTSTPLEPTT